MDPNIRFPLVNIKLTAMTESRKKTKPKNDVRTLHRHLHFLSFSIFFDKSSDLGTSSVKSASGLPPGYMKKKTVLEN